MEMVRERTMENEKVISKEEQEHNARISERYLKLKNAVEDQFAEKTVEMNVHASVYTPDVTAPKFDYMPVVEQRPQVTEYIRNLRESIFSSDVFNMNVNTPKEAPVVEENVITETQNVVKEGYSLTTFAKVAMVTFGVVVISMMALIGVNSRTIEQKNMRIQELQARRQELVEQNAEIQRRIQEATSEETIRQYAESQGMIKID